MAGVCGVMKVSKNQLEWLRAGGRGEVAQLAKAVAQEAGVRFYLSIGLPDDLAVSSSGDTWSISRLGPALGLANDEIWADTHWHGDPAPVLNALDECFGQHW